MPTVFNRLVKTIRVSMGVGLAISLIGLGLVSCEKPVELPLPAPPRMLVINTVFMADSVPRVWVFAPQGMLAPGNFRQPAGISVRLRTVPSLPGLEPGPWRTLDRVEVSEFEVPRNGGVLYYWTDSTFRFETGVRYQVEAEAPGYGQARGSALVPPPPVIEEGSLTTRPAFSAQGDRVTRFDFVVLDPADQGRTYYQMLLSQVITYIYNPPPGCSFCPPADTTTFTTDVYLDPVPGTGGVNSGRGLVFSNRLVQGQRLPLSADSYGLSFGGNPTETSPTLTLRRVDENFFRYFSVLTAHQWGNYGGLFAPEPVTMPNNVEGGAGIVGAATERVYTP